MRRKIQDAAAAVATVIARTSDRARTRAGVWHVHLLRMHPTLEFARKVLNDVNRSRSILRRFEQCTKTVLTIAGR